MSFKKGHKTNLGRKLPPRTITQETREKIRQKLKGKKLSLKTRKKMSEVAKQKKFGLWMKGKERPKSVSIKQGLSVTGSKHWNWQGGKTAEARRLRANALYKEWRATIFKRDNYTCQKCGHKGRLQAHHIKSFAKHKELRFSVDNGITYCIACHSKLKGHRRLLTRLEREKIRRKLLGRKMSPETRAKMSKSKLGITPWNKGLRKLREKVTCLYCSQIFEKKRPKQTFCSRPCVGRGNIVKARLKRYPHLQEKGEL